MTARVNSDAVTTGPDGVARCWWAAASSTEMRRYHDDEWGVPVRDDRALYEHLCLEGFQAGLSWSTVLHKRAAFRSHFADFDFVAVSRFTDRHVERMMGDASIIRNRAKIIAAIDNARVTADLVALRPGALTEVIWRFQPVGKRRRPRNRTDIPDVTPEAEALSRELRRIGYRFVGPTTMYALMQSAGVVDDHVLGCHRAG